ncbi:DNA repair and recombination protein RadB [Halosimplex salinum]|uniref:DNA repair and recombination protein RadB n=1 Tax=Halosimplex salinum TaxID=1710538 RepID=UPI000F47CFFB|nr:DNA repair and recombination protein RadB [Halosimplex salinum]
MTGDDEPEDVSDRIPTGCGAIDDLLGGGFERGAVTQVYGPPAAGKTNVVLSAAVELAARGDSALLIDTEGLSVDRMEQLAGGRDRDVDDVASRLIVTEAHTFEEQEEAVRDAEEFVDIVDFIAVDSATGFYRLQRTEQEEGEALRAVGRQLAHLLSLARKHDIAVAFTNQVFTDIDSEQARGLGGHTLNHWSATILRVDRFRGGNRRATLEKHRAKAVGEKAQFKITDNGLESGEPR